MIVTIHQPNFIPWYPFFQKMSAADVFILLGNCQYEKNGYQNRFNIDGNWNTMSVKKGAEAIVNKKYINPEFDWMKIKKRLWQYNDTLSEFDQYISNNLYETNRGIITHLRDKLNITTPIVEDTPKQLLSSERLLILCKEHNATHYLAGQGGRAYLNEEIFKKEGIEVIYQDNITPTHTLEYLYETT